jgi:aa3 type cytochrome c oxidase subunit IV
MADHKHGEMDITTQTATFNGFIGFTKKFVIAFVVLMVFLVIFRT